MRVAIVALGGTKSQYLEAVANAGGRKAVYDETWCINALGDCLACDRVFHMDDVGVQERRAEAGNTPIANMVAWLRTHPGPIYTSTVRDGYPGMVAFPLEEVLKATGTASWPYLNTTTAYPMAYAIYRGDVESISLFGMDFVYQNGAKAEDGRACLEYWCGQAEGRGIVVRVASRSKLKDTCVGQETRLYGYDGVDVKINGKGVEFTPKELPTAAEIEARYAYMHRRG